MKEFDKILRDKLNEEEDFPRMEQNWQKLSARMAAVATPEPVPKLIPHPQLVAWKWAVAATGLLLVSSNIWWWFQQKETTRTLVATPTVQEENATNTIVKTDTIYKIVYRDAETPKLEKEVILPNEKRTSDKIVEKQTPSVVQPNFIEKPISKPVIQPKSFKNEFQPFASTGKLDNKPVLTEKKEVPKAGVSMDKTGNKIVGVSTEKSETKDAPFSNEKRVNKANSVSNEQKVENEKVASTGQNETKDAVVSSEKNKQEPLKTGDKEKEETRKSLTTNEITGGVKENLNKTELAEKEADKTPVSPKKEAENKVAITETVPEIKPNTTVLDNKKPENTAKSNDIAAKESSQSRELTPIVKPLKWKPSFSIGVNAMVAYPAEKELSPLKGGGVSAGLKLNEHFRADITASAGELDYNLKTHKPQWHIPRDPRDKPIGGPPPGVELREIKGHQMRKQLALSLTYLFGSKGWLTPKAELGYAVQRLENQTARFEFRDPSTGTDLATTETSAQQTFKNLWNIGLGAEKNFGRFTADVSAVFQKDFSDKSVDMLVLRGGLRYNF
jgi:hypothetical protein